MGTDATLDATFGNESDDAADDSDGEDIRIGSANNKASRYTIASTSRRHLLLGAMLAEVENAPPEISLAPQQVPRKASVSLTNPPKRKSLLEQIDEDFPMTRSARVGRGSLPLPDTSLGRPPLEVVPQESLEAPVVAAPRRHSTVVWSEPIVAPPVSDVADDPEDEGEGESPLESPRQATDPPSGRSARRRVRKTGAKLAGEPEAAAVQDTPAAFVEHQVRASQVAEHNTPAHQTRPASGLPVESTRVFQRCLSNGNFHAGLHLGLGSDTVLLKS